jgi:hypothetical protein
VLVEWKTRGIKQDDIATQIHGVFLSQVKRLDLEVVFLNFCININDWNGTTSIIE